MFISDLLVFHNDCFKQHMLRRFNVTRVQSCAQAPSALESTERKSENNSV